MIKISKIVGCLIALLVIYCQSGQALDQRPNIVVVNLDDADRDMFRPTVLRSKFPTLNEIAVRGMTFSNFYVCSPKCGPSRACLLRGQYAHVINHRTNSNSASLSRGFTGGFQNFLDQGFYYDDFGKWMRNGGYETVFVGKYMNGITEFTVPPGWDHFYLSRGSEYYDTHRFTNRKKNKPRKEKTAPGVYRTDAEVDDLVRIIDDDLSSDKPFLIYYAPFGPHTEGQAMGGMVATELEDKWPNVKPIRQADYNEKNNSDKPIAYRQLPPISFENELEFLVEHRKRMLAVKSIDNGLARIIDALKARGFYQNTYLFVTSDNGFSLGQHRTTGKGKSLSRASHVPFIVSGPGIQRNSVRSALASQIDIAPTILDLAKLSPKTFFDGKSLTPVLFSRNDLASSDFRDSLLVENWEISKVFPYVLNTTFCQLRTPTESYTEWADGSREFYDLSVDPLELRNNANRLTPSDVATFKSLMNKHRRPMAEPIGTIEKPSSDFSEISGPPFQLGGVAEDSSRIKKVELVIRNVQTRKYWNGTQWQVSRKALMTTLSNPNGIQTEWSYTFSPPEPDNPRESYVITARAFSNRGTFTRNVDNRKFKYDSLLPVNVLKNPRVRQNGKVVLWGTATDNIQIKNVEVIFQRVDTDQYLYDNRWQNGRQTIKIEVEEDGNWEWVSPFLPPGSYVARARAVDTAGNREPVPQVRRFSVN